MKNIVLIDFTPESINSLKYAIDFLKPIKDAKLELINVSKVADFNVSNKKLYDLKEHYSTPDLSLKAVEITGDLMEVLPDYINGEKTGLVFCGTHDMKFLENIFSSRVLKLMHSAQSNFIFVPDSIENPSKPKHILTPILANKDSLQSFEPLLFLKHFLNFELTLCSYKGDEDGQGHNLLLATKILDKAGVKYSIEYIGDTQADLLSGLEELAVNIHADTISIVDFTEENIFNYGARGFVEELIRNSNKLGVVIIQNKELEYYSSFHTTGGY
jgi:hypothetical protein